MPFIHMRAKTGRSLETKQKAVQAIVKAASEAMGTPETSFNVVYEEIEPENWQKDVAEPIIEPLRDKLLIERGKLV